MKKKPKFIIVCKDVEEKLNILSEAFSSGILFRFTVLTKEEYFNNKQLKKAA